ncbi:hypothetical protein LTS13_005121 [Exophiala xenobiotica]|nr:hypothetical protein LTS06_012035 [Exophiala xenobiotica]KAK5278303.1 hypothetical protein LTR40_009329 [Exophiala xenobiotica]KAK5376323.1 hypothetical protein LTS13_005121 [Exophiala xenobiotica]KAK5424542.1 hypothetical protein LTR90_000132 [Exophiala xenobiotica]KAK5500440.1 hypothetical protein LTR26_000131 [Exophiala xenobiotica]
MSLSMPEVMPGDGFGLELLTGQANYSKWARGFRIVALSKGLWRVFDSTNQEEHYTIRSTHLETRLAAERGLALLLLWIDPALRPEVENVSPLKAWNYLEKEYKMDYKLAVRLAHLKACSLRLQDCENMTDYLNQHKLLYHDFTAAGDTEDLESFLYGIVIGLGVKYTQFLQRDDIEVLIKMGDVVTLTGKLLRFETELGIKERANKEVEAEVKSTVVAGSVGAEVKRTVEAKVKAALKAEVKSIVEAAVKCKVEAKKVKAALEAKGKSTVDAGKDDEADWEPVFRP